MRGRWIGWAVVSLSACSTTPNSDPGRDAQLISAADGGSEDAGPDFPDARTLEACPGPESLDGGTGRVRVYQQAASGMGHVVVAARFPRPPPWPPEPPPSGCLDTCVVGPRYRPDAALLPDTGDESSILAGTVVVDGLLVGFPVVLRPPEYYFEFPRNGFGTGLPITITATGAPGGVPAFAASLATPPFIDITLPSVIDRTNDLALSWTVGSSYADGQIEIEIRTLGAQYRGAVCTFPIEALSGQVPAAVLLDLEPGRLSTIEYRLRNRREVEAGDYRVTLEAEMLQEFETAVELR